MAAPFWTSLAGVDRQRVPPTRPDGSAKPYPAKTDSPDNRTVRANQSSRTQANDEAEKGRDNSRRTMPGPGLEPGLPCGKGILSPSRLPVSPSRRHTKYKGESRSRWSRGRTAFSRAATLQPSPALLRAGNGTRTRDPNLGKVVLYQLSYSRASRNISELDLTKQVQILRLRRNHQDDVLALRTLAERVDGVPYRPRQQTGERCVTTIPRRASVRVHDFRRASAVERRAPEPLQD